MPHVPYNTGKVRIGLAYEQPRRIVAYSRDAELLQSALIGGGTPIRRKWTGDVLMWVVAAVLFSLATYLFLN